MSTEIAKLAWEKSGLERSMTGVKASQGVVNQEIGALAKIANIAGTKL